MINLHADKLYGEDLFTMPLLSRYSFTYDGRVKGKHYINIKPSPRGGYSLKGDDDKVYCVMPSEIIAYGKNLDHTGNGGEVWGYMKIQSKINKLTFQ